MGIWNYHLIFIEHPSNLKIPKPPQELKNYIVRYIGANALYGTVILPTGSKEGWELHELQHNYVEKLYYKLLKAKYYRVIEISWGDDPHTILNLKNTIKINDLIIFAWETK